MAAGRAEGLEPELLCRRTDVLVVHRVEPQHRYRDLRRDRSEQLGQAIR